MNTWFNMFLQDSNTFVSEQMIFFHDLVMTVIVMILSMILFMMIFIMNNKFINRNLLQGNKIEIIWTTLPMFILLYLSIPSLKILYLSDEVFKPVMSVKAIGHQWYWSYEYFDFCKLEFNSFMLKSIYKDEFRLLDVDNRMVLPMNLSLRILISSMDVIHSWAVPSLGVKVDAVPGRINQIPLLMIRPGLFFGQCSEICGANHSFMPIVVESVNFELFKKWIISK